MKKLYILSFLFLCVATRGFSFGGGSVQDCGCCQNPCCWEFAAEYLLMQSSIDQPYYVIDLNTGVETNRKRYANEQRWHSGYRLEALYHIPCNCCQDYLKARWTHFPCFRDDDSRFGNFETVLAPPAVDISGVGDAHITDHFNFYSLDVLFGERVYCSPCLRLAFEAGIKFSHFRFSEHIRYALGTSLSFVDNKFHFFGVGPELALDFSYHFIACLSVNGRASASILINDRKSKHNSTHVGASTFSGINERYWFGTPTFDARFGLNYHTSLCFCGCDNLNVNVEVGYEVIHYVKAIDRLLFVDDVSPGISFIEHQDFTFHGPYFRFGVCF